MGKKKRSFPDVEEILARPWCYYCERDFEDLKLLISHQKAKHFKCERCGRRLNTAGGLAVHLSQVHKETLTEVDHALPNRQGLEVEIFGMEGIPQDILEQHKTRIVQNFYQAQEDRRIATGNPLPGDGKHPPRKKIKMETPEELKARLHQYVAQRKADKAAGITHTDQPKQLPQALLPQSVPGQYPMQYPPPIPGQAPGFSGYGGVATGLPTRPSQPNFWPPPPGVHVAPGAVGYPAAPHANDDIDDLIRSAETNAQSVPAATAATPAEPAAVEKKKKDKGVRMIYSDTEVSPEEKMALLQRYAFVSAEA
ncbi:BUB3-interacting and GLEBS motif-containing protein ZNF207 [Ceratocystis fimbriata CBS 114723]|uniref:BUB3-interacting and GLEBS motif-containing protein ZNF207 n=1 Tax=Ceratocystis fimbriata CBS 114723 TaxID=1035309 RepID=A0A2C5WZZ8_9PEZI|nr:BUB3-interacting and GLEBS motif-containing protein ZNF207 [Ceratocystis fimbriata CBS 114723]